MDMNRNVYEVLPQTENQLLFERESGRTHSAFAKEFRLFSAIESGDAAATRHAIDDYLEGGITAGRLSGNSIRQIRYWAVSCIATAIHYSILGGLDETDAYNMSDEWIQHIDGEGDITECIAYLREKALVLTGAVNAARETGRYPAVIRNCMHYIHIHLHEPLSVRALAGVTGLSREYLSVLFRKTTGKSIHEYVLEEKVNASLSLLRNGKSSLEISSMLGFSSQSHFIQVFRKHTGMTPEAWRRRM